MRASLLVLVVLSPLVLACSDQAGAHARLGDELYASGDHAGALAEYRLALAQRTPDPVTRAKAAAAALHAGDLIAAAEEYRALAVEGPERATEAADGLERVALQASADGDREALQLSLAGLLDLEQGRALGAFAMELTSGAADEDAVSFLPIAAAFASGVRQQDSLMFEYASALDGLGECERAAPIYEAVARRERNPRIVDQAKVHFSRCALEVGRIKLDEGHTGETESWFRRAVAADENNDYSRAAYIGLGDLLWARDSIVGAVSAYQRAIELGDGSDSLSREARMKINEVGRAGTGIDQLVF